MAHERATPIKGRFVVGRSRRRPSLRFLLPAVLLLALAQAPQAAEQTAGQTTTGQTTAGLAPASPQDIAAGHKLFNENCAHCHGPDAIQGVTRINLRLLHHRYGDNMDQTFFTTVTHGRITKGMPNWSGILSDEDFHKILAFLHSVQEQP